MQKLIKHKKGFFKLAKNFSDEIGIAFGLDKCVKTTFKSEKLANKAIKLNLETAIKEMQQGEMYNYFELMRSMAFRWNVADVRGLFLK